ncbi:MAG TPA: hypothetical protein VIK78_14380 [Ruminiclostridium sp.]
MHKEWKVVTWVGVFIFILFLGEFRQWSQEDANQFINILLIGYFFVGALFIIDGLHKWIKKKV